MRLATPSSFIYEFVVSMDTLHMDSSKLKTLNQKKKVSYTRTFTLQNSLRRQCRGKYTAK